MVVIMAGSRAPAQTLDPGFHNLHSAFGGVEGAEARAALQRSPELVRWLPGMPAGAAPVQLAGYEALAAGTRQLWYYLVHAAEDKKGTAPLIVWLQVGTAHYHRHDYTTPHPPTDPPEKAPCRCVCDTVL